MAFMVLSYSITIAQIVSKNWEQTYSSQDSIFNTSTDVTANGDIFVSGYTITTLQGNNIVTIKYDEFGAQTWVNQFDLGGDEVSHSNVCDNSGNVYVLGNSFTLQRSILLKYSNSGTLLWSEIIGSNNNSPNDLILSSNGDLYTLTREQGLNSDNAVVTRFDDSGNELSSFVFDSGWNDTPINLDENATEICFGLTSLNAGVKRSFVVKLDQFLTQDWEQSFDVDLWEDLKSVKFDVSGDVIVLHNRGFGVNEGFLISIGSGGNLNWDNSIDIGNDYALEKSLEVDPVYGVLVVYGHNGGSELVLGNYGLDGFKNWDRKYYADSGTNFADFGVQSSASHICLGGTTFNGPVGVMTLKGVNLDGSKKWSFMETSGGESRLTDMDKNVNGEVVFTGSKAIGPGLFEISTISLTNNEIFNAQELSGSPDGFLAYFEDVGQIKDINGNEINGLRYYGFLNSSGTYLFDNMISNTEVLFDGDTLTNDTIIRWDFLFAGANVTNPVVGAQPIDFYANYYLGDLERERVNGYTKVVYQNAWNGIDIEISENYYGNVIHFIVHPDANVADIKIKLIGCASTINGLGTLENTILGHVQKYAKPIVYSQNSSTINQLSLSGNQGYVLSGQELSFDVPPVENKGDVLVIEMTQPGTKSPKSALDNFKWSSYIREPAIPPLDAKLHKVITDNSNASYYCGGLRAQNVTQSPFPTQAGAPFIMPVSTNGDMTILKINDNIEIEWGTYIGGAGGDEAVSMAFSEPSKHLLLVGYSNSNDFPLNGPINSYQQNALGESAIVELDNSGQIIWSTRFECFELNDCEIVNGNLYVVGSDAENDVVFDGLPDYFSDYGNGYIGIFKLGGFHLHGTRFGKSSFYNGNDETVITGIDFDGFDNYAITGSTKSDNFPTQNCPSVDYCDYNDNGFHPQAFVSNLDVFGNVDFSYLFRSDPGFSAPAGTFYNDYYFESIGDRGNDVRFSPDGQNIYIIGETYSWDFFTIAPSNNQAYFQGVRPTPTNFGGVYFPFGFIVKVGANGIIQHNTYYGAELAQNYGFRLQEIEFDLNNNYYIIGHHMNAPIGNQFSGDLIPHAAVQPQAFNFEGQISQSLIPNSLYGIGQKVESFVLGFNQSDELIWSNYVGGMATDQLRSIATSNDNRLYFTGLATTMNGLIDSDPNLGPASQAEHEIFDFPRWEFDNSVGSSDYWSELGSGDVAEVAGFFDITNVNVPAGTVNFENISNNELLIYPNPNNSGVFYLKGLPQAKVEVALYNSLGEIVLKVNLQGENLVYTDGLTPGIYVVNIVGDNFNESLLLKILR